MSRMPLRFKLTVAFTGVMAVLLTGAGIALSLLVAANLDSTIDDGLAARAGDAAAVVGASVGRSVLASTGEPFAQVLDGTGKVIDSTTGAGAASLLDRASVMRARQGVVIVERRTRDGAAVRLLARPVKASNTHEIVVVGEPLAQRERALGALHALLAIGGPIALLFASVVGYILAAAALRPVERMRRHAAAVTASGTSERLPVPDTNDEIGRLGRTLNEMLARLEVAFKRERAFVSDASHELRTPLAILRTELELALRGKHTQEELEDALRSAAEESERLSGLADDLLVIARSDQGRLPVRPEPLEAGEVLERVAGRFQTRARAERRPLMADPSPGVTLNADLARIEQALANLVDNALTYGHGTVKLSARAENGSVELHVFDEGAGFPPDFLPRAFERFTRADEARTRGGTGLGLAIAAAVAGAHGGSAHAQNIEGGAEVWIALPS
ncbi:MAG: hypothetical protein QOJ07_1426 [Thermoleophilaceae bacterium]|nr:hypothetical protein [Thermoleophilaceae bacterium]